VLAAVLAIAAAERTAQAPPAP